MKDLDVMRRAKGYLDALAQGVDPISGTQVPDDSVLSQDRLRRCFQYVSGVLARAIAEQVTREKPVSPSDYGQSVRDILAEAGIPDTVAYSPDPERSLGAFVGQLNAMLRPLGARALQTHSLFHWLKEKGVYTQENIQTAPVLTELGRELGVQVWRQAANMGTRDMWRYGGPEPLQRFVAENLEEFIAWDNAQWDTYISCIRSAAAGKSFFSPNPLNITSLVRAINMLVPRDLVNQVSVEIIGRWLVQMGYMHLDKSAKKTRRRARFPTDSGVSAGILYEENDRCCQVLYAPSGQQLILHAMPAIIDSVRFLPTLPCKN